MNRRPGLARAGVVLVLLALSVLLPSPAAHACLCGSTERPDPTHFVFEGTATDEYVATVPEPYLAAYLTFLHDAEAPLRVGVSRFAVERVLQGAVSDSAEVTSFGTCGLSFQIGKRYRVTAWRPPGENPSLPVGILVTGLCGGASGRDALPPPPPPGPAERLHAGVLGWLRRVTGR